MWCLIRFHWAVCHYFISRAIWWASVSRWKTLRLRGEQWVHRQQSVNAPVCEGPDGEDRDKIEWDGARDMWGSACCYIIFSSWFTVLTCRRDRWIIKWKACLSQGSSVFLSVLRLAHQGGFSAATQQEALCVCFQPSTEKALYLQHSVPTVSPSVLRRFCRCRSWCEPLKMLIQLWESCCCSHCCRLSC